VVLSERHLLRLVREHARYYNNDRPHMSLCGDAPASGPWRDPSWGRWSRCLGPEVCITGTPDKPHDDEQVDRHHR
jgi:hypothetical protein